MKKIKHSKYRNTILLFELLTKQVAWDVLSENNTKSINILKKYFNSSTELIKEYKCYQRIISSNKLSEYQAVKLFDAIISEYKNLNHRKISKEKYNLIGEIKNKFPLDSFFDTKIRNYKVYASLYKIFESNSEVSDIYLTKEYDTVIKHLIGKTETIINDDVYTGIKILEQQDPEIKKAAFKLLVTRFNEKYSSLLPKQKKLINKYITENVELDNFKKFIFSEVNYVKRSLFKISESCRDEVLKIKIENIIPLLDTIVSSKRITENHMSSLLKYYELIDTVKKIGQK